LEQFADKRGYLCAERKIGEEKHRAVEKQKRKRAGGRMSW
jgi:hypothetical protein